MYAVGGHDGSEHLGNMEMFDPLTNKWMMKASMNTKRYVMSGGGGRQFSNEFCFRNVVLQPSIKIPNYTHSDILPYCQCCPVCV